MSDMSGYTSNRVYSGVRLLKAEQAIAHRRRALAALERQDDELTAAARALLADVRRRYPGEELRCEYMRALDAALVKRDAG